MKKTAILWVMFFIIFSQIYADENSDKLKNISFSWQLYNYQESSQNINYINLNPMFYEDYLSVTIPNNIELKTTSQNNRKAKTSLQRDNPNLFASIIYLGIAVGSIIAGNEQARGIRSNMWAQQREMENFYRKYYNDPARNYYQAFY